MPLSRDARKNREYWDRESDEYQGLHGKALSKLGAAWGTCQIPERRLRILGDVVGLDVLELGCGAAQWSIALARQGARPVALDNSARQLEHARREMAKAKVDFPLVHASAERVPLPDRSFDLVFCDHGGMSFGDPGKTLPEVARLLRPGGLLVFNMSSPLWDLCWNDEAEHVDERLHMGYFDELGRWEDEGHVEYQLPYGQWIRLFRANGFIVEDLVELQAPPDATSTYRDEAELAWARRWPAEHVWKVRRT